MPRVMSNSLNVSLSHILKRRPWCLRQRFSRSLKNAFEKLIIDCDYDLILVRYEFNAQYLIDFDSVTRNKIVLDFDDLATGSTYKAIYGISTKYSFKKNWDYRLLCNFEQRCVSRFRNVLVCTEEDRQIILENNLQNEAKICVIPNIINETPFLSYSFRNGYANPHRLLFVGSLNYLSNVEGIIWFVEKIFRPFKAIYEDAVLDIVGKDPKEEVRLLERQEGIRLYANVPDVRPFYEEAKVIVVPVLWGGGTRIKILEGALTRRPILSTSFGVEGLRMEGGKEYLLFEDADAFITQYRSLDNEDTYNRLTENALQRVRETYSLDCFKKAMKPIYEAI